MTRLLVLTLACLAAMAACDPVHDDATSALGGEAPGVRKGPLHRPGQPCVTCHDGAINDPPKFSVAGTIYQDQDTLVAASGATVTMTSSNGDVYSTTTNAAGNFYVQPSEYSPQYPMRVSVQYGGVDVKMTTTIGRDGSCADCHVDPAGPTSAGHIFVPRDGVTP